MRAWTVDGQICIAPNKKRYYYAASILGQMLM